MCRKGSMTMQAMRLDPRNRDNYLFEQGYAHTQLGRYEEAIPALKRDLSLTNNLWDHVLLARDYVEIGHEDAKPRRKPDSVSCLRVFVANLKVLA